MKKISVSLFFLLLVAKGFSQNKNTKSDSCSYYLNAFSYFWKLDSLGINGYRFAVYNLFLNSILNNIDSASLLEKLGKPNEIYKYKDNIYYRYFYLDGLSFPKEADAPPEREYIYFLFTRNNLFLSKIGVGYHER